MARLWRVRLDLQVASSPADSPLRSKAEPMWPGWAKFLRDSGDSAVLLGLTYDGLDFGRQYGGSRPDDAPPTAVDQVLTGAGNVLTISARTVRLEAR